MKRDMELVRQILQQVEAHPRQVGAVALKLPGHTDDEINYHIDLLAQAGFLEVTDTSTMQGMSFVIKRLTWDGHEFLDAIRNDTVWNKVKETVKEKGGAIPFELLKALALKVAASVFGVG